MHLGYEIDNKHHNEFGHLRGDSNPYGHVAWYTIIDRNSYCFQGYRVSPLRKVATPGVASTQQLLPIQWVDYCRMIYL